MGEGPIPPERPSSRRQRSIPARLLGTSARGARRVAAATGLDAAAELASEEMIVRAVESQAVERAVQRVLAGPVVEEAMTQALKSPAVEAAIERAIDSEMVDRVWERLLASDEAQQLVERVAEAPEVRAAIAAQGVGLIEDIGRQVARVARRLDDALEAVLRRLATRPRRSGPTADAGLISRGLAAAVDAGLLNGAVLVASALLAMVFGDISVGDASAPELLAGGTAWAAAASAYLLAFWSLAGQTPGMRFLGLRIETGGKRRIGVRRATRRLLGLALALLPLGAGLLGIVFSERRRGLQDAIADTEVVYSPPAASPARDAAGARTGTGSRNFS